MNKAIFSKVQQLVQKLEVHSPLDDERRAVFEEFLAMFPTYPPIWKQYISEERACVEAEGPERVMKLFYRCLPNTPDVDLFLNYIDFVKSTSHDRKVVCAAYDYALSKVGRDMNAIPLYEDYVKLADTLNTNEMPLDKLRKVYQRALLVPMEGLQEFFKNYRDFEIRKSQQLAQQLIPEQEKHFKSTATVYHIKKKYHKQLNFLLCTMDEGGYSLLHQYRLFIEYEKSNPLSTNPETYREYVEYAYRLALTTLRYVPLLWLEYGQFLINVDTAAALKIFAEAVEILPDNLMLSFMYAELLESKKKSAEACEVYRRLIKTSEGRVDHLTLATIQFLKFLQRTEGPAAMRKEFISAVESTKCSYHLFLAMASIENTVNANRDAALRILKYGLEFHSRSFNFVEGSLKLLIKMEANTEISELMAQPCSRFSEMKLLKLYKMYYEYLLYSRNKEDEIKLREIEEKILKIYQNPNNHLDQAETKNTMSLRRYFLPTNYKE